ncbi:MAG: site-specific integrase [Methanocorpusculum sp.]|nr:site-specific integrase [Methanocorpusculum sp.]
MAKKRANGEGNIRKRKDGRWEGRYTVGYDEQTGKRLIKNVLGKTQAEVKEKLAKAVAEAETVDVRRADEYTLGTWLQTWYELYAKPHLRFSTAEYYRRGIELHIVPRLGDIPLKKLTGRDLQWLYKDLQEHGRLREAQKGKQPGLSDSTIRGIHTMLHNALDRAVKERLIVRNPADDCVPSKIPKHEMKILPPEQIKSYLTAAEQRGVLPMFYLELISGLRKGELVALQWSDLDVENKTISVSKQAGRNNAGDPDITRPKTENSIRKISIPQDAVDLLIAEHQKHPSNPWMFPSPKTSEMYHPDSVVNIHKKILKDAGLEHLRFHDLRHSCASLLLANGVPMKQIQEWLGHSDFNTTANIYAHLDYSSKVTSAQAMEKGLPLPAGFNTNGWNGVVSI